jgi:hypothetical protein
MLEMVTQREMEKIFAVTDRLGIHRESVSVPLGPRDPGRVRKTPAGKFEIVAAASDFETWLAGLEAQLQALQA